MRRIKTVVMIVGVALSVAPIFNYVLAQQGNSSTELLLQVQGLRQEIAELRDMVERQQFQLKKMQQAQSALTPQQSNYQQQGYGQPTSVQNASQLAIGGYSQAPSELPKVLPQTQSDYADDTSSYSVSTQEDSRGQLNQDTESFYKPYNADEGTASANQSSYEQASVEQQRIEERTITAAPIGRSIPDNSNYPPVVDRSFSTTTPVVPVTGAGSQSTGDVAQPSNAEQAAVAQPVERMPQTSGYQVQIKPLVSELPPTGTAAAGVIVVPSSSNVAAASSQWQTSTAPNTVGQVQLQKQPSVVNRAPQNVINAAQTPVANNQFAGTQVQNVLSEDDYYDQGFELLKQSKYEQAASIFEQQLKAHPNGDLADDAHYWIAEAMHVSRNLDVAKMHLKTIIKDYPQSRRLPDAMLKTAYIEQTQGNQIEARILFQEIVSLHPQSDAAIAAKNQLAAAN